jgi:hypothetical protein
LNKRTELYALYTTSVSTQPKGAEIDPSVQLESGLHLL